MVMAVMAVMAVWECLGDRRIGPCHGRSGLAAEGIDFSRRMEEAAH